MKISEAILYIVNASGGTIQYNQFAEWLATLIEKEYLEMTVEGENESVEFLIKITDKGKRVLVDMGIGGK
jgi:predicted transcriptional regulator